MAGKQARRRARPGRLTRPQLEDMAREMGAKAAKVVDPRTVETAEWVRWKCRYGCGGWDSSLVCPPHTPHPGQTRAMLDGYRRGVLFEGPPRRIKEIAASLERRLFLDGFYKALGLGSGPCMLCDRCAFDEGCRYPRQARPSMEACGIDVFATVRRHGFHIDVVRTRKDPQHHFGLVLVD